jgi:competence protein ComEC
MGDLEASEEEKLINNVKNLDIDILKVGHHGSITSTTENFVNTTTPSISLISVGTRFKSIPGEEVIKRLNSVNSRIYRTDKNGAIVVKIDRGRMYVETKY